MSAFGLRCRVCETVSLPEPVDACRRCYGPTDLTTLYTESPKDQQYLQTFLGGPPSRFPAQYADASPVTHVSPSSPPFLIYQGTADTAVAPAQAATSESSGSRSQSIGASAAPFWPSAAERHLAADRGWERRMDGVKTPLPSRERVG